MKLTRLLLILLLLPMLGLSAPAPTVELPPIEPTLPSAPGAPTGPSLQPANEPGKPTTPEPPSDLTEGEPFRPMPQPEKPKPKAASKKAKAVNVEFIGAKAFKPEELRAAIADTLEDIAEQGLDNALADDAAFYLSNFYREHGYSEVDVIWATPGSNSLKLTVNEGRMNRLGRVTITGNKQISRSTLMDYLLGPAHERFPREQTNPPFVEADIESGVEWTQGFYTTQGFLNATLDPPQYVNPGKGTVDVTINIREGIRYTFGEISFSGTALLPREQLLKQLAKARSDSATVSADRRRSRKKSSWWLLRNRQAGLDRQSGSVLATDPYNNQEVGRLQQALEYYYKTQGYFNATVESSSDPAKAVNGKVAVTFQIQPGDQYRFDSLTVAGVDKLKPDFLPKRFKKLPGQIYDPEKVQKKVQEMTRTGLFKSFRVHQEPLPDHTVRLDLTVEEAKAKELGFLLGFSTLEGGILGASYKDRNLFGEGRPLTTTAQYSTKGLRGDVSYTDPWFLNDTVILRLRLYALTRQYDGYSKLEEGFRTEIARKIKLNGRPDSDDLEVSAFILTRHVDLQDVLIQPAVDTPNARENLLGPTSYTIDSVGLSANWDTRDSKINPTRGFFLNSTLDSASSVLGSQVSFVRATAGGSYYLSVGRKGLLAFGARAGVINPFKERGSIPIDERFFNGGSLSVRSFLERHLGPKDAQGFPVGGDSFTVFNVEYDHPIRGELAGATFLDAGSLSPGNGFGQMRYGVGLGLRYRLPIGPLRLDYGYNPTRKEGETHGAFHFSFGFAF